VLLIVNGHIPTYYPVDADFVLSKFNPTMTTLMYSTFISGWGQDYWEPKVVVTWNNMRSKDLFFRDIAFYKPSASNYCNFISASQRQYWE